MTRDEAEHLLKNWKRPLIRIKPNAPGGNSSKQHAMAAILLGLRGADAIVKPTGHKKEEYVDLNYVMKWHSKMPHNFPTYIPPPTPIRDQPLSISLGEVFMQAKTEHNEQKPIPQSIALSKTKDRTFQKKYTEAQWDECRKLKAIGKTYAEIGVITGMHPTSVHAKIGKEFPKLSRVAQANVAKMFEKKSNDQPVVQLELPVSTVGVPVKERMTPPPILQTKKTLFKAIRSILDLPIPDTSKLLAIEGLISHED